MKSVDKHRNLTCRPNSSVCFISGNYNLINN
nr:MAG TPA: hypothetical protein [Caudoviricetes sp.]